jgi:hypothetical protein
MKSSNLLTTLALAMVVLFTGCKKDDFVEVAGVCPLVISTSPVNLATSVPLNQIITATFNEKMNPATIIPASFSLSSAKKSTEEVVGVLSYNQTNNTMSFVPNPQLTPNTTYTGTVKSTVMDLNGNALQANYVWTFSTGLIVNPTVISTDPINLASGVALNKTVTATFSEAMNSASFTAASFTLKDGVNPIAGAVSYAGTIATFNPTADLLPGKLYTATITTAAANLAGTPLTANYVWTFTTLGAAPTVILTDPLNLATGVVLNKTVTAGFSEAMNAATFTATSFMLKDGVNPVAGAVTYAGTTASFNPTADLLPGKLYTATITTAVTNPAGIPMAVNYVWTFTTLSAAPTVILTDPLNLATGVVLNKTVTAGFSEVMNAATFTVTSFMLKDGVNPVAGAVTYAGTTASFNPTVDLLPGKLYTATLTTGVQNVAGTAMAADYVWTFTTLSPAPTVTLTDPLNLASAVVLNKTVTANFSEAMSAATITATSFTLMDGANPVAGVVSYAGTTATFNPNSDLVAGTLYTATITTAAQSAGGTALASDYVWTFTTIAASVPTVTSTDPLDLATAVALNKVISANFSETMDNLTITDVTFTLMDGVTPVLGTVNYAGTTATFTPTALLVAGKTYTATITTGAQSSGGTALASDYVWEFSTIAALPLGPGIVNLGTAANFVILAKSGISTTGLTAITGDIGVSPIDQTALTGFSQIMDATNVFSTSIYVTGKLFASDYAVPTPTNLTTAISDMETALTTAMGMTTTVINELGAGDISGMTLAPGLYKWTTGLLITGAGVTLSGGPDDTWVFQIDQDMIVNSNVILSGGAQAKNIFWVTAAQALLNTGVDFSGNIIASTLIDLKTGAKVTGRLLSQTAVTLDAATVVKP